MEITLSNGKALRGDLMIENIIRSDLVPIPETVEATVRYDPDLVPLLKEGEKIKTGTDKTEYRIIWTESADQVMAVQGNRPYGTYRFIAVLEAVHKLAFIQPQAIIKDSSTLGTIYRSCGATASIGQDLGCGRFSCMAGSHATENIMRILQRESAAITWDGFRLYFQRITDLMNRKPVKKFERDTTQSIQSGFLERHTIPAYYSTDLNVGNLQAGDTSKARKASFADRHDLRTMNNMTKVLVTRKLMDGSFAPVYRAGDVFDIAGKPFVIITALHAFSAKNQYSRFWLGDTA